MTPRDNRPPASRYRSWKSHAVLLSLWTDPAYLSYRLRRLTSPRRPAAGPAAAALPGKTVPSTPAIPAGTLDGLDVDLVYCWVDGQDPAHRTKRDYWVRQCGLNPRSANPDVRYVEHDELRYSLRSAEKYAPWVRRIFIVTDGQTPRWLNASHPRITLIDQNSIAADPDSVPVFNSMAIEAQLHRIPGLSEHFIYCNDDMFFGQSCHREDFFTPIARKGGVDRVGMVVTLGDSENAWIVPWHWSVRSGNQLWMAQWNNVKLGLESWRPWRRARYVTNHQAQSMTRRALSAAARQFPKAWRATCRSRFRQPGDHEFLAMARYMSLWNGEARLGRHDTRIFRDAGQLNAYTPGSLPKLFCVNEERGSSDTPPAEAYRRHFPEPSSFES